MTKPRPLPAALAERRAPSSDSRTRTRTRAASAATARPPTEGESVEAFLARGGVIERLAHGARGQPLLRSRQQQNEASYRLTRARLDKPRE